MQAAAELIDSFLCRKTTGGVAQAAELAVPVKDHQRSSQGAGIPLC